MKKRWWMFLVAPPAMALFVWIFGEVVMHLWNWLLPMLFGWRQITFWQALGVLVLCRILFGGFGGNGHGGGRSRWRWRGNWERMSPEERERFRHGMHSRCGDFRAPTGGIDNPA